MAATGRFAAALFAQRRVRVAVVLLGLLSGAAIYAPLLANDRPYLLRAIEIGKYEDARRSLAPILESMASRIAESRAEASHGADAAVDGSRGGGVHERMRAVEAECSAARNRLDVLRAHLAPQDRALLDPCASAIERALEAARAGRASDAGAEAARAIAAARALESELVPADPSRPERGGRALQSRVTHPLLASLTPLDAFFMCLWAMLASAPLWMHARHARARGGDASRVPSTDASRASAIHSARNSAPDSTPNSASGPARARTARSWTFALVLIVPSIAAAALAVSRALSPVEVSGFAAAPYKAAIARGEILVERALFPPFAMGFAETNLAEANRPPTWTAASEISDEGYYVHGSRARSADPITGLSAPPAPVEVRCGERALNAPLRHPLGTDGLGRDLFARVVWGGRTSLTVGLVAALLLTAIGVLVGSIAGYCGGAIDAFLSRAIEIVLCVPAFFLILAVLAFTDPAVVPPMFAVVLVIAGVGWTGVARLVRAEFLRLRELEFVLAARATGASPVRIVGRHMLPHALGPVLVAAAFAVASCTLYESTLSFLGLGVSQPIPSWGSLVNDSHSPSEWWMQVFPGTCLFAIVLAYNLLGEGIRRALDPRSEA
jgi:peptide/nickel transport system permease protein